MRHVSRIGRTFRVITLVVSLATIFSTAIGSSFAFAAPASSDTTSATTPSAPDATRTSTSADTADTSASTDTTVADTTALDTPTVSSDQSDYHPGETVNLSGDGWSGDDTVRIVVNDDAGQTWRRDVIVNVGATGGISDSFSLPNWFVANYSVTATGQQTGRVATASFTDTATYINLNLVASAPDSYDHATGGGAFDDDTTNVDTVESLEGGDFQCGEVATFLTEIEKLDTGPVAAETIRLTYAFTLDTTGTSGLALGPVTLTTMNYGAVQGGDGPGGTDSGIVDDGGSTATLISQSGPTVTQPPYFTSGEDNVVVIDVNDLEQGEITVLRIDAEIQCKFGSNPTGNLQASITDAKVTAPDADDIPVGNQTVPFKAAGDVVFPAKIIVDKVTDPSGAAQSFDFRVSAPGSINSPAYTDNFSLTDAATPHDSGFIDPSTAQIGNTTVTFADTYKVEELNIPSSWQLDSISCTTNDGGGAKTLTGSTATSNSFNLNENEIVTCVFNDSLRTGSVTGDKYEDTDADGTDDGVSDPPIESWNVYLFVDSNNDNVLSQTEYDAQAATVTTTSTNASGAFTFSNVVAGEYIVCEASQLSAASTGWFQSQPGSGNACNVTGSSPALAKHGYAITVTGGGTSSGNTFGNFRKGTVNVHKYEDLNKDGDNESGADPDLSGWTVYAYKVTAGPTYTFTATATTDSNGDASFSLNPGTYLICEAAQRTTPATTGWTQSEPVVAGTNCTTADTQDAAHSGLAADGYTVTVTSNSTSPASGAYEFGNWQQGSVRVLKYEDLNKDGDRNGSDAGLSGWTISAFASDGAGGWVTPAAATADTGAGGTTSLSLDPGTYLICENAQRTTPATTGWTESEPVAAGTVCSGLDATLAGDGYEVTVTSHSVLPSASTYYEFGNWQQGSVRVLKYEDLNKDGDRNGSDAGLSGWTISAFASDGAGGWVTPAAATADTGAGGTTSLSLDPGTYLICENAQRTTPATTGWTESEPVAAGTVCSGLDATLAGDGYEVTVTSHSVLPSASTYYEFGNWQQGSVRVLKYEDLNKDGDRNGSDAGLSGWTFRAYRVTAGPTYALASTQVTVAGGTASFSLDPGDYLICEYAQRTTPATTGWTESEPVAAGTDCADIDAVLAGDGYTVTVTSNSTSPASGAYEFGNWQQGSVRVLKYEDLNKDGDRNGSDAGLSGWTISAFASDGAGGWVTPAAATADTGAGGTTSLSLDPGTYLICENAQRTTPATTGWTESEPVAAGTVCSGLDATLAGDGYEVTVTSHSVLPSASTYYEFGNWQQGSVRVLKYEDLNKDGDRNGSDAGLSGWTISAFASDGAGGWVTPAAATADTGAGGTTSLSLDPGTYLICENAQRTTPATTGWTESEPVAAGTVCSGLDATLAGDGYQVTVTSHSVLPGAYTYYEFGNWQQGTVRVHKYLDSNANGANNSEPNLSGWTINVYASDGAGGWVTPPAATGETDANGQKNFSLDPGTYLICESAQRTTPATDGWVESQPVQAGTVCSTLVGTNAADGYQVTVTSHAVLPTASTSYEFGNYQPVKVQITKTVLGGPIPAGVSFTFNLRSGAVPDPAGANAGYGTLVAHGTVNSADNVIGGDDWIVDAVGSYPLKPGTYQICEVIVNGFTPDFVLNGTYGTGAGQWFSPGIVGGPGYSPAANTEACFTITVASGDGGTTHTVSYTVDNAPPGMSRTIGYWKNWTSCDGSGNQAPVLDNMIASATDNWIAVSSGEPTAGSNGLPDIRLGDRVIEGSTACKVAVDILDKRLTANDNLVGDGKKAADSPAWNAGSQLLAYELNQLLNPGSSCAAADTAAIYTRRILNKIGFTGKTNPTMTANEKTALNYYAGLLDNYNNNTLLCGTAVVLKPGTPDSSYDYLP